MSIKTSLPEDDDDFYPGTTELKRSAGGTGLTVPVTEPQPWEALGTTYLDHGMHVVLYPISALAMALERKTVTIRHWDQQRIIPPANNFTDSRSEHGRRRLYTRAQIFGLQQIAESEGLLAGKKVFVHKTKFIPRAFALFTALNEVYE